MEDLETDPEDPNSEDETKRQMLTWKYPGIRLDSVDVRAFGLEIALRIGKWC
jgi:hypothetical protein